MIKDLESHFLILKFTKILTWEKRKSLKALIDLHNEFRCQTGFG